MDQKDTQALPAATPGAANIKDIDMPPLPEEVVETPQEEALPVVESKPKETVEQTKQQANFKALRLEKERIEREHQEAMQRLAEYEKPKQPQQEEDLEINIGDDDLFEGKHYRKLQKQLKKQQDELKKYQEQISLTSTETKLKSQYADFDKVVSEDNIRKLRETEPELAETIASTQDVYSKAVSAYKIIKKLGIYVEDNYSQDREIAQKNSLKPKPLASVSPQQGDSPLSKANAFANGLTPELKQQLWKEMEESAKNY
jgi:hypothetical protein